MKSLKWLASVAVAVAALAVVGPALLNPGDEIYAKSYVIHAGARAHGHFLHMLSYFGVDEHITAVLGEPMHLTGKGVPGLAAVMGSWWWPMAEVDDRLVSVDGVPAFAVRIYRPHAAVEEQGHVAAGSAPSPPPPPAIVYFHGGGWRLGGVDSHDAGARRLAHEAASVVVSVEYRLSHQARFPAAADDAVAAVRWVQAEAAALRVDPRRIAVGGDSAGGNLAAAVALYASRQRRDGGSGGGGGGGGGDSADGGSSGDAPLRVHAQLLLYPALGLDFETASYAENSWGPVLTKDMMVDFWARYQQHPDNRADPLFAPLAATDAELAGVAPALVVVAQFDVLRDEGTAFHGRLQAAGVPATLLNFARAFHGFLLFPHLPWPDRVTEAAWREVGAHARRLMHPTGGPGAG